MRGCSATTSRTGRRTIRRRSPQKLEPGKPALYLDCGTEDGFGLNNGAQYLHDLLLERNIEHAFFLGPGQHDFRFWKPRVPESLKFLRAHNETAGLAVDLRERRIADDPLRG